MGDLIRRNTNLAPATKEILEKHKEIKINELLSRQEGIKQRLKDLENIEQKKLEVEYDSLEEEIRFLKAKEVKNPLDIESKEVKNNVP